MRYLVYQEEVGESGTHHFQGYIEMPRPVRFTHFRNLERAHFEPARGTPDECIEYCTKEDTRVGVPFTYGEPSRQGKRSDLIDLRNAIIAGRTDRELLLDDQLATVALRYSRGVQFARTALDVALPRDDVVVKLHYGPAGMLPSSVRMGGEGAALRALAPSP